jgi:hypothetical protein
VTDAALERPVLMLAGKPLGVIAARLRQCACTEQASGRANGKQDWIRREIGFSATLMMPSPLCNGRHFLPSVERPIDAPAACTRSWIFATPASAQASSLAPPGAPPTPSAATISLLRLIAAPPANARTLGIDVSAGPGPAGFLASSASWLVLSRLKIGPKVTSV